jgi:Zn-dependent peptidase ImmA (M78 family)/transcriptional regulator with XRE-family HTH domain
LSAPAARSAAAIFDKDRLRLARQLNGLRKAQLAERIDLSAAAVGQYEAGVARPSPATLAKLSFQLGFPVEFFAAQGDPVDDLEISTTFFRSLRRTTQMQREQAVAHAAFVALIVRDLERRVRLPQVDLPEGHTLDPDSDPVEAESAAAAVREAWGLGLNPIEHVVHTLERHGIIVFRLATENKNVDAFSRFFAGRPVVALGSDKSVRERSRFDAAHELGHLVMHPDPEPASQPLERQAHRFAAALLLPRDAVIDELPRKRVDWVELIRLKRKWGVSLAALLYRARQLGTMSNTGYESAMKMMSRKGWRRREPGDVGVPEEPALLPQAMQLLADHGTPPLELSVAT